LRKILLISVLLLIPYSVHAACVADGSNWATTPDYASVASCVSQSDPEDTITVSAGDGTETWSSALTITKGINLIGPGKTNLTVTLTATGASIVYDPSNYATDYTFRITGFTFTRNNCSAEILTLGDGSIPAVGTGNKNKQTKVRVDNNDFTNTACTTESIPLIYLHLGIFGVVDHNTMSNSRMAFRATHNQSYDQTAWQYWAYYPGMEAYNTFGHGDSLYVENNDITLTVAGSPYPVAQSSQDGMRWVWRYNNISVSSNHYPLFDVHGNTSSPMASVQGTELYGNNVTGGGSEYFSIRGGQAMAFYNKASATSHVEVNEELADVYTNAITGQPEHIWKTYIFTNMVGGTTPFGHVVGINTGADAITQDVDYWRSGSWNESGGTVTSGVGCGTAAQMNAITTCSAGVGYWATTQSCSNISPYVGVDTATPISGTLYVCNGSNTWVSYYTPFTYPHPLAEEESPGVDTTPAAFTFTDNVNVPISTMIYSGNMNPAVSAIDNDCSITISGTGCEYRVNGGSWLTSGDNVVLNDNVALRRMSDANYSTDRTCELILGGTVSDVWHVTTIAAAAVDYAPVPPRLRGHLRQRAASNPPGPPADLGYVGHIAPTAAQSISESPYSNNGWTSPEFIYSAGEASITSGTFDAGDLSYILKGYGFNFSAIPDGATIDGVEVIINARYGTAVVNISLAQLLNTSRAKVGDNKYSSPQALTTSAAGYTVGGAADKWGNALTPAWVKDADFGVALGFTAGGSGNSNNKVYVDSVTMKVWYTP
jgi:hypothetical protein